MIAARSATADHCGSEGLYYTSDMGVIGYRTAINKLYNAIEGGRLQVDKLTEIALKQDALLEKYRHEAAAIKAPAEDLLLLHEAE